MPTTLLGLLIFISFLTPGFLNYVQRRRRVPQSALSPLVETATLTSASLASNAAALLLFAAARAISPEHTPDVGELLRAPHDYVIDHLAYVVAWGAGLLALSCVIAIGVPHIRWLSNTVFRRLTPVIIDTSSWYHVFEDVPEHDERVRLRPFIGCEMADGTYVSGTVAWYSTETSETPDRTLVLADPLHRIENGKHDDLAGWSRLIISAKDIVRMNVAWIEATDL